MKTRPSRERPATRELRITMVVDRPTLSVREMLQSIREARRGR